MILTFTLFIVFILIPDMSSPGNPMS
jgi:hypothetical protein